MFARTLLALAALLVALSAAAQQKPVIEKRPAPQTSAASGKEMYQAYCASCHGMDGKGDGPAAAALKTQPTDLTILAQHNAGKFPKLHVYHVISGDESTPAHGSKDMPVWGPVFRSLSHGSSAQVQLRLSNLASYLESIQAK